MDKFPAKEQEPTDRLTGPFTAEPSGMVGYQIIGGDGAVAVWVVGERNARCVAGLLNMAYDHGLLN